MNTPICRPLSPIPRMYGSVRPNAPVRRMNTPGSIPRMSVVARALVSAMSCAVTTLALTGSNVSRDSASVGVVAVRSADRCTSSVRSVGSATVPCAPAATRHAHHSSTIPIVFRTIAAPPHEQ